MTQNPTPNPPMDWYPDPADATRERYWDGERWTHNTRPAKAVPVHPSAVDPRFLPQAHQQAAAGPSVHAGHDPYAPLQYGQAPVPPQAHYPQAQYPQDMASQQGHLQQPTGALTADGVPLAGWWSRAFATIIDNILISFLTGLVGAHWLGKILDGFGIFFHEVRTQTAAGQTVTPPTTAEQMAQYGIHLHDLLMVCLVGALVSLVYGLVMLRLRGATLGQTICGIRVVPTGQGRAPRPLGWAQALRRQLVFELISNGINIPLVAPLFMLLWLVNTFLPLGQAKRQALHDLAAATQVVRTR